MHCYNITMKDSVRPVPVIPPARTRRRAPHPFLDRLGATGSLLCAIHCALLPLVIALLPSLGIAAWLGNGFERGFPIGALRDYGECVVFLCEARQSRACQRLIVGDQYTNGHCCPA